VSNGSRDLLFNTWNQIHILRTVELNNSNLERRLATGVLNDTVKIVQKSSEGVT